MQERGVGGGGGGGGAEIGFDQWKVVDGHV